MFALVLQEKLKVMNHFGKCYYGIIIDDKIYIEEVAFKGRRNEVRMKQTMHILKRVYDLLL